MNEENVPPINLSDDDAPFSGPDPAADNSVSTHPTTDGDLDAQEYYDEGLAEAAEHNEDSISDGKGQHLPDGFHIE